MGDPFAFFNIHCCKTSKKLNGEPFGENKFFKKVSQCRKKTERGALWDFSTSILSQNIKKLKGDPLVDFFSKQSLTMPKKTERGTFSLFRCCVTRKEEKIFWFSSLRQMIQFGTIKFCKTLKNYFCQFV